MEEGCQFKILGKKYRIMKADKEKEMLYNMYT